MGNQPDVVVSIVERDGRYLLLRRRQADGRLTWVFPGGKRAPREHDCRTAEREVYEETGLVCHPEVRLGMRVHPDTHKKIAYWVCRPEGGHEYISELENKKIAELKWFTPEQVLQVVTSDVFEPVRRYMLENDKAIDAPLSTTRFR